MRRHRPAVIRRLSRGDDIRDLIVPSRECFREHAAHHPAFFAIGALRDGDIARYFSRFTDTDDSAAFVALAGNRTVGYVTVSIKPQPAFYRIKRVGAVSGLMVDMAHRRRGIAGELLARTKTFLQKQGIKHVTVYTATANEAAIRFYERNGIRQLQVTLAGTVCGDQRDRVVGRTRAGTSTRQGAHGRNTR